MPNTFNTSPKVVAIGGGTGLSVMLRGLKQYDLDLTAIVTVADDGGSSGRLRSELKMPPPGDIRNVLTALGGAEPLLQQLLQYRFKNGNGLAGHSLGNLILAAMKDITGDFVTAIQEMSRVLAVRGQVLPASEEDVVLKAEMADGTVVSGESNIPRYGGRIKRVFLEPPEPKPLQAAITAIGEADAIVIGPGSLYTSILPNLLVNDMATAIRAADALKLYVCNIMTQPGETDDFQVSDHVRALQEHVGASLFDYVLANDNEPPPDVVAQYREKGATVVHLDEDEVKQMGYGVIVDHFWQYETYLRHHTGRLSARIVDLIRASSPSHAVEGMNQTCTERPRDARGCTVEG